MTKARMVQLKWPRPWMYTNSELFYGLDLPGEQQDNFPLIHVNIWGNWNKRLRFNSRATRLPTEIFVLKVEFACQTTETQTTMYIQFACNKSRTQLRLLAYIKWDISFKIMYQSNRSSNILPGQPPGHLNFWKIFAKFPPPEAEKLFKCPIIGPFQVIKCPHPRETLR